jgi:hypothetical protein
MPNPEYILQNSMSEAKGTTGVLTLPAGLIADDGKLYNDVEIREITGAEEDLMVSRKVPPSKKIPLLVARCVTRLGPLKGDAAQRAVQDLTSVDQAFLLLRIRQVSLGDELPYEYICPNCNTKDLFLINLEDLEITPMPDPMKRVFDTTLYDGTKVRWHVLTGRDEVKVAEVAGEEDKASVGIFGRLDLLGENPPTLEGVKKLGIRARNELRDMFSANEGNLNTEVTFPCKRCGDEETQDIDLTQRGFFFPSQVLKRSKKSISSLRKTGAGLQSR